MESWAKSMNKKKEIKPVKKPVVSTPAASNISSGFTEVKSQGFLPIETKKDETMEPKQDTQPQTDSDASSSNLKVLARISVRHVKKLINMFLKKNLKLFCL